MQPLNPSPRISPTSTLSPNPNNAASFKQSSNSPSIAARKAAFESGHNNNVGLGMANAGISNASGEDRVRRGSAVEKEDKVTSPQELTVFVDNLLVDLENKFDAMSSEVLNLLSSLSTRVDTLEASIGELVSGTGTGLDDGPVGVKRNGSLTSPPLGVNGRKA